LRDAAGRDWVYSDIVKDHFFYPRNLFNPGAEKDYRADGVGYVGSPACGDMMKLWIKVDRTTEKIQECKWQTFGCASAIASTSMLSVMVTENGGLTIDQALQLRATDILERLGGLPSIKIHCSVLGDKALRAAINDYFRNTNQYDRIIIVGGRVIDKVLKITDQDIAEAVRGGASTLAEVQAKTKVGSGDPACLPEVESLIEKYISELPR
jgi:nitrogen fixation NifU-like protein/NifU-like protein